MMDRTYRESIIAAVLIFSIVIIIAAAIVIFAAPAPKACAYQLSPAAGMRAEEEDKE